MINQIEERRRRARPVVYFVLAPSVGLVKIGRTKFIKDRFFSLQMQSPVPLELLKTVRGGPLDERQMHERFSQHRVHGEWFHYVLEIQEFVKVKGRAR